MLWPSDARASVKTYLFFEGLFSGGGAGSLGRAAQHPASGWGARRKAGVSNGAANWALVAILRDAAAACHRAGPKWAGPVGPLLRMRGCGSVARLLSEVRSPPRGVVLFRLARHDLLGDEAGVAPDRGLDLLRDIGIVLQERLRALAPLPDALAVIGEPGAGFFHDTRLDSEIDDLAHLGDTLAVHDGELDLLERRRELVLDHLDAGLVADHLVAVLD